MLRLHRPPSGPLLLLAAAASAGLLEACLPDLDPALLDQQEDAGVQNGCWGGTPNGVLDPGEACDDANVLDDDGCSSNCELLCDGLLDEETGTCYVLASPEVAPTQAASRCEALGGDAQVLTIRSDRERDLVTTWLSETSLEGAIVGLYATDANTWRWLAAGVPGWSASLACPGCYASWAQGQPQTPGLRPVALMVRDEGWNWRSVSKDGAYPLICERPRAGRPRNLCELPSCDPVQSYEFRMFGYLYRVRNNTLNLLTAQQDCVSWGGHLVVIDSEEEREMLVRFGPSTRFWVGLYRPEESGEWLWVDGLSTAQRPVPWSSAEVEDSDRAAVLMPSADFDTNLVEPVPGLGEFPYVCRKNAQASRHVDVEPTVTNFSGVNRAKNRSPNSGELMR